MSRMLEGGEFGPGVDFTGAGFLGRKKNQKTGYLDPQKSNKKGSIMAYMGSLYGP